jgi:hypothetical protein
MTDQQPLSPEEIEKLGTWIPSSYILRLCNQVKQLRQENEQLRRDADTAKCPSCGTEVNDPYFRM